MRDSNHDDEAGVLLRAAERSLFDATARVEQAVAALGQLGARDAASHDATLAQVRLWLQLIQARLDRTNRRAAAHAA
ncbi:MAG: hypothetical protein K1X88_15840 [Nannocystaceae bacterium]|nr:hypothetical protein [Nannocystaceae bacterium]